MRIIRLKEVIDSTGLARRPSTSTSGRAPSRSRCRWETAALVGLKARCMSGSWQGSRSAIRLRTLQPDLAA